MTMRLAGRILVAYLLLTVLFTGAVVATFAIPRDAIEGHLRQSVSEVVEDGQMFTCQAGFFKPYIIGVFTECLMLDIAYCADTSSPLQSAMESRFVIADSSPVAGIKVLLSEPDSPRLQSFVYSRYWHGSQCLLRPLLCVTTMRGIRTLNVVLLLLLLVVATVVMVNRLGTGDALVIALPLLAVMIPTVPLCLNYVPTFAIALGASLLILLWNRATGNRGNAVLLFFVVGAVTAFMDLLTTPMVALAVPLTVYMLYRRPHDTWRCLITLAVAWAAGYALLWGTKWLLAGLVLDFDVFGDAMGAVTQRTVGKGEHDFMMWCLKWNGALLVAAVALTVAVALLYGRSRDEMRRHSWMLAIAAMGFVWTFVLLEHTWHHLHFTWRTFVVSAIGIALYLRYTTDLKHPLALFRERHENRHIDDHKLIEQ